jgi:hypothetical protein
MHCRYLEKNKKGAFYSQITTQSKSTPLSTQYNTIKTIPIRILMREVRIRTGDSHLGLRVSFWDKRFRQIS